MASFCNALEWVRTAASFKRCIAFTFGSSICRKDTPFCKYTRFGCSWVFGSRTFVTFARICTAICMASVAPIRVFGRTSHSCAFVVQSAFTGFRCAVSAAKEPSSSSRVASLSAGEVFLSGRSVFVASLFEFASLRPWD